jgi:hypothetical protein
MWARAANWTFLVSCRDRAGHFGRDAGESGVLQTSNDWVLQELAERGGFDYFISSKYSDYYHLRSLACVYAGCKHILIFGCSGELSPQSP